MKLLSYLSFFIKTVKKIASAHVSQADEGDFWYFVSKYQKF